MPYVKQERRPALDEVIDELVKFDIQAGDIYLFLSNLASKDKPYRFCYFGKRIDDAVKKAEEVDVKPNGDINYILFKYCKYNIEPSYNNYKAFMGEIYNSVDGAPVKFKNEFRESAEWIRIKLLTPYEEKAIERNGDV